jgi:hypothetical protein
MNAVWLTGNGEKLLMDAKAKPIFGIADESNRTGISLSVSAARAWITLSHLVEGGDRHTLLITTNKEELEVLSDYFGKGAERMGQEKARP